MLSTKPGLADLPWKLLAIEAVLVVASVLLALALDSWREQREQQSLAQRALHGLVDEADANCRQIVAVRDYHQAVIRGEREPEGIQVGLLRNDAWDVVKTTGAAPWLDYELVAIMAEINANQTDHRAIVQAYLGAVFSMVLEQEEDRWHQPGERGVIRELVRIQERLLEGYRRLAAETERTQPRKPGFDWTCSTLEND